MLIPMKKLSDKKIVKTNELVTVYEYGNMPAMLEAKSIRNKIKTLFTKLFFLMFIFSLAISVVKM
jgi:hypothetical protein